MAGKIAIRRVGNFLPHLCLAGLLMVAGLIIWLSTVGLPNCALRYIEQTAAEKGLPVRIEKIQLVPRSGFAIKAEGISLDIPQADIPAAELQLRKALLIFSPGRLFSGDWTPQALKLKGGFIQLPFNASDSVELKQIDIHLGMAPGLSRVSIDAQTKLHGIDLQAELRLPLGRDWMQQLNSNTAAASPRTDIASELAGLLEQNRDYLRQLHQQLAAQQWSADLHPAIKLKAEGSPRGRYQLEAWIPSYDADFLHIRDARVEASYAKDTITIHSLKLRTIEPDTTLSLQGAYNLNSRELAFNTRSSAPVIRILETHLEDTYGILNKIKSPADSTPTIELDGNISFAENFALNSITLRGKLEQRTMHLGRTKVNQLQLSFFLRDGNFNIDNLFIEFTDGHLRASAQAENGAGAAKIDVNLSDETLLTLARDFSNNDQLQLPEGLSFDENVQLRADCQVQVPVFVPGESRIKDLLPSLSSCHVQFNTNHIAWQNGEVRHAAATLHADGIELTPHSLAIKEFMVDGLMGSYKSATPQAQAEGENLVLNLKLSHVNARNQYVDWSIDHADIRLSAEAARMQKYALSRLHATTGMEGMVFNCRNLVSSLCTRSVTGRIQTNQLGYDQIQARNILADFTIPHGLNMAEGWQSMQRQAEMNCQIDGIQQGSDICLTQAKLLVQNTGTDECRLSFSGSVKEKEIKLSTSAAFRHKHLLLLNNIEADFPLAVLAPLMGGEPLEEIRLPELLTLRGDVLLDIESGRLVKTHYDITIPELIRVCRNVYVHKGMEIPLALHVKGEFSTSEAGEMLYEADIEACHKLGELDIHVKGNPLKECTITGSNTIPVNIINALIDNTDAHWIMRDFRCTDGVTRNNISDINATIRYDKGIYIHALCKAHLQNMEFMLGVIRDKFDAQGKETGEEYIRKDLSSNPYTMVKEGRCDVEVLVQMDCVDEQGAPLPERIRINLTNPDLLYDNRPWLKRMGFKKGALTSRITGEAVRFNIENSTITLHKLRGNCYPSYSIGMYYAPIQHYMEDLILQDPVDISTDYCLFPISRSCDVPMKGIIKAHGATGAGFRFLGTTIPFSDFNGFINISDTDVYLDRMNAKCWGGIMRGGLRIGFSGKHTTLDGYLEAHNMNLKNIVASYGGDFKPANCNGFIRFQAARPELEDVVAYGQVSLKDGDLMQISLFRPISSLLSDMSGNISKLEESVEGSEDEAPPSLTDKIVRFILDSGSSAINSVNESTHKVPFANHFLRYSIDEAHTRFDIRNGHLITRNMNAKGYNLDVATQLDIDLDKLTMKGNLWPQISSVPTILASPLTILSKFFIDINIYGDIMNPKWKFGLSQKLKKEKSTPSSAPRKAADAPKN